MDSEDSISWPLPSQIEVTLQVTLPGDDAESWSDQSPWPERHELLRMVREQCDDDPDLMDQHEEALRCVAEGKAVRLAFHPPHPEFPAAASEGADSPASAAAQAPTVTITCMAFFRESLTPLRAGLALARGLMELSPQSEMKTGDWTAGRSADEMLVHDSPPSINQPPHRLTFSELITTVATPAPRAHENASQFWTLRTEGMHQLGLPEIGIRDLANPENGELEGAAAMMRATAAMVLRRALGERSEETTSVEEPARSPSPRGALAIPTNLHVTASDTLWLEGYSDEPAEGFAFDESPDDADEENDEPWRGDAPESSDDDPDAAAEQIDELLASMSGNDDDEEDEEDEKLSPEEKRQRDALIRKFEDEFHAREPFEVNLRLVENELLIECPTEHAADSASRESWLLDTATEFLAAYQAAVRACHRERKGHAQLDDPVYNIEGGHPALQRARELARETLPVALEQFRSGLPESIALYVKQAFPTDDDDLEFMWVLVSQVTDENAEGTLANEPHNVPWLNVGDAITVPLGNIDDWMLRSDDGSFTGGFSINVIREYGED